MVQLSILYSYLGWVYNIYMVDYKLLLATGHDEEINCTQMSIQSLRYNLTACIFMGMPPDPLSI